MKSKHLVPSLLIAGVALLLTGCIWLRLLAFKNQLADLDRYVKVEDRQGLTLHFVKPVLYAEDFRDLITVQPTARITNGNRQTWLWTFQKQSAPAQAEPGDFDLTFATSFEDGKFNELVIPERFLVAVQKPLLLGVFRSLGQAQVDTRKRSATAKWAGGDVWSQILLPTKSEVTRLLGAPCSVTESNLTFSYLFEYSLKTASQAPAEYKQVRTQFRFAKKADKLLHVEGTFAKMGFDFTFEPDPNTVPAGTNNGP
jgi:hypothetical protein